MEGFLPITKSFWGDFLLCPWHAFQIKVNRVKAKMGRAAWIGIDWHKFFLEEYFFKQRRTSDILADIYATEKDEEYQKELDDLLNYGITNDPVRLTDTERQTLQVEVSVLLDANGYAVKDRKKAAISMRIDRLWLKDSGVLHINDGKSGGWEDDSMTERHFNVLGGRALLPGVAKVEFSRFYAKTGSYPTWTYDFTDEGMVITHPKGSTESWKLKGDPLLAYTESLIKIASETPADPKPGPHCESWYGEPCQFYGIDCPLGEQIPVVTDAVLPTDPEGLSPSGLLRAIAETGSLPLSPEQASFAYSGGSQLLAFAKKLLKNLERWSLENGPITQGEAQYGWFTTEENAVDKEFALTEMLRSDMTIEEIAKVVSVSKSGIDKSISKRKHGELRENLLNLAVSTQEGKPKFGLIRKAEENTDDMPAPQ